MLFNKLPRTVTFAWLASVAVLFLLLVFFNISNALMGRALWAAAISAGDAVLLTLPLWLLGSRWRWIQLVIVWIVTLLLGANTLYMRYCGDLLAFRLIFDPRSYNDMVAGTLPDLIRWSDWLYILLPAALTVLWVRMGVGRQKAVNIRVKVIAAIVSAAVYALGFTVISFSQLRYMRSSTGNDDVTLFDAMGARFGDAAIIRSHWAGVTVFMINQSVALGQSASITLDDAQQARIRDYFKARAPYSPQRMDVFRGNRDKNLVFIVVESLNSYIVGESYGGHALTPTLDSLLLAPGTVSCLQVYPQIKGGGSSDGQLIYNTGLLPISSGSAALMFGDNVLPGLPKVMGYDSSFEVICEDGYIWNHNATNRSNGYRRLVSGLDPTGRGQDAVILETALSEIERSPQPFMAEVTTVSMHFPYIDQDAPRYAWIDSLPDLDKTTRNYLQTVHFFDTCLGRFMNGLHRAGLADNTVVVLASDHSQIVSNADLDPDNERDQPIVFIAANTGLTEHVDHPAGQVDVYPTVLQIMDRLESPTLMRLPDGSPYTGLGMSILDPRNKSARGGRGELFGTSGARVDSLKTDAFSVSDLMIRSDYFK